MLTRVLAHEDHRKVEAVRWPSIESAAPSLEETVQRETDRAELARLHSEIAALQEQIAAVQSNAVRQTAEAHALGRQEAEAALHQEYQQRLQAESERFSQMMSDLLAAGPAIRHRAEEDLVKLAVAIARRILHRELNVDSDAMLGLVKAAISRLDQREMRVIRTDPDSFPVVERVLKELNAGRNVKLAADPSLKRGALVIETTRGQFDASIESQLQEIQRGFADVVNNN